MNLGKLQIIGHTNSTEPRYDKKSNSLYIDTGAFRGNRLSCAIVEQNEIIEILSIETKSRDLY